VGGFLLGRGATRTVAGLCKCAEERRNFILHRRATAPYSESLAAPLLVNVQNHTRVSVFPSPGARPDNRVGDDPRALAKFSKVSLSVL
jgi:hypothetical protein